MVQRDLLETCGRAMFGGHWQNGLSEALGVHRRSMRRWVAGTESIPWGVWLDISRLLANKETEVRDTLRLLEIESAGWNKIGVYND